MTAEKIICMFWKSVTMCAASREIYCGIWKIAEELTWGDIHIWEFLSGRRERFSDRRWLYCSLNKMKVGEIGEKRYEKKSCKVFVRAMEFRKSGAKTKYNNKRQTCKLCKIFTGDRHPYPHSCPFLLLWPNNEEEVHAGWSSGGCAPTRNAQGATHINTTQQGHNLYIIGDK